MGEYTMEQISIFELSSEHHSKFPAKLPGFEEVEKRLIGKGYKADWIYENVDANEKYAVFDNQGKKYYNKSNCPFYEGYWFTGSARCSVQCQKCEGLIPGIQYWIVCSKKFEECIFYKAEGIGQREG